VLINDILDYSKIEAGKITFEEVDFDLRRLIVSVEQSMSYRAQEKNLMLDVSVDARIPEMLVGDPVRLGQILNNLISNAIKFTERGLVRIEAAAMEMTEDMVEIKISVSDTGIGIPEDKLEYIFERFTQAGADTTRKFGGTGLGLAITKRLLEMQNSRIFVESVPDLGSRFHFSIRFKRGGSGNVHPLPIFENAAINDLSFLRILLIEDNEANTIVATKFLNQWGIQPDYATNGQMAVEMVQHQRYDLLLMDLQMPVMDGYTATRYIRSLEDVYFQKLPIIALTASAMSDVKQKLLEIGMNDYVTKPFNPPELYNKITYYTKAATSCTAEVPAGPRGKFDNSVLQAIDSIAGDDQDFKQRLIAVYIQALEECKSVYEQVLSIKDEPSLRELSHKMYPTLSILSANQLLEEFENGKAMLRGDYTEEDVAASIQRMIGYCERLTEELENLSV
jgi:CheY-like chemotaxis protein